MVAQTLLSTLPSWILCLMEFHRHSSASFLLCFSSKTQSTVQELVEFRNGANRGRHAWTVWPMDLLLLSRKTQETITVDLCSNHGGNSTFAEIFGSASFNAILSLGFTRPGNISIEAATGVLLPGALNGSSRCAIACGLVIDASVTFISIGGRVYSRHLHIPLIAEVRFTACSAGLEKKCWVSGGELSTADCYLGGIQTVLERS